MVTDGPAPRARPSAAAPAPTRAEPGPAPELLVTLLAEPTASPTIRRRLRHWLADWGWTEDDLDDVVMAVDEAVANVVDHAYRNHPAPGDVHVYAWVSTGPDGRRVTVSVTDRGRWRAVPTDPGYRGRGLLMMSTCMASMHIEHSTGGTAVTMTSTPVPDDAAAPGAAATARAS